MNLYNMPPPGGGVESPTARWAAWVRGHWGEVCVTTLDARRSIADTASQVRVRAAIHLGRLSPSDVCVHATFDSVAVDKDRRPPRVQLFSVQSYRNGAFVFEAAVGTEELEDCRTVIVHVQPRSEHAVRPAVDPVARSFALRLERVDARTPDTEHGRSDRAGALTSLDVEDEEVGAGVGSEW